eukprot:superscaffoldBa00000276_g3413
MAEDGYPSVNLMDSHATCPPVPPRLSQGQQCARVGQKALFILVSVALCGMIIEACLIRRLYQTECGGYTSLYVMDNHATHPPVPPRLSQGRQHASVGQTLLFILMSVALCGMTIEACLIYRLYQTESMDKIKRTVDMAEGGHPSVYVVDSHATFPPVPPRLSQGRRRAGVGQTLLFILMSVALCGMTIEACLIYRLYQAESKDRQPTSGLTTHALNSRAGLQEAASIPFFACELKAVTPYRRGFFCGDSSITYPYVEREAIPDSLLIAGGIAITGLTIALGECYRVRFRGVHSRAFVRNRYVSCLYKELGSFLFGCCVGQSLTNMAKLSVGRLRPNFLSVCNITYASINCTPGSYVSQVTCRQHNQKMVEEARKSFFSGHASFAMYTMLYLAFYLQARLSWRGARLLRPLIQFLLVMIAIYTGLSRISDYRHHPTDVLTGFIQGGLTAYWVAFYISSMFKPCARPDLSPTNMSLESPLSSQQTVC